MERGRHRKSRSASGIIEGNRQVQKQKAGPKLSSDSRYYSDGTGQNDMLLFDLGPNCSTRVTGTPMKKLLAEEMSKEVEARRRSPSIIARLMGLDGLPSSQHVQRQQKSSDHCQLRNAPILDQGNSNVFEHRSSRTSVGEQEFKDVYEDLEASHVANRRCSSRFGSNWRLSKHEMELIQQKFMDAKRLSTDERLQNSKEYNETLEALESNKELLLKFLQQPDSWFRKHVHDLQQDPNDSLCSHIAVLKPSSNPRNYESSSKTRKLEKDGHKKREDCLLLDSCNYHSHCPTDKSFKIQSETKDAGNLQSTRIVVLKPNLGKRQNASRFSSPDLSYSFQSKSNDLDSICSINREKGSQRLEGSPDHMGSSRPQSKEARAIAKQITERIKDSLGRSGCGSYGDMNSRYSRTQGYAADESSYDAYESDTTSGSETRMTSSRHSFGWKNRHALAASTSLESCVSREAKRRLSERWKMAHNYQDIEICRGSTLGEMLAKPDQDTKNEHLTVFSTVRAQSRENAVCHAPLGISSRDGWKDRCMRNQSRSESLSPSSFSSSGRGARGQCESLVDDGNLMPRNTSCRVRSKVDKRNLRPKRGSFKGPIMSNVPSPVKTDILVEDDYSRSQMFIDIETLDQGSITSRNSPTPEILLDSFDTDKDNNVEGAFSSKSSAELHEMLKEVNSESSFSYARGDLNMEGQSNGQNEQDPGCLQLPLAQLEPENSESSKEADHPSPVSVLEVPFAEDVSPESECFSSISAGLHELRMQIQLLKMESEADIEVPETSSVEDNGLVESLVISQENIRQTGNWKIMYIDDVLMESGFQESDPHAFTATWESPECPLGLWVFYNIEKNYIDEMAESRCERRLFFDQINSALSEIIQQFMDLSPWIKLSNSGLHHKWGKIDIRSSLHNLLASGNDILTGETPESRLDKELHWFGSQAEIGSVVFEISGLLLDDLTADLLSR